MILIYAAPRRTSKAILLKPYKPASILARKHETVGPLIKNSVLNKKKHHSPPSGFDARRGDRERAQKITNEGPRARPALVPPPPRHVHSVVARRRRPRHAALAPPVLNHVPSTRTQGNRFAVVTRALCGRKTSKELVAEYGTDGYLSRSAWKSITCADGGGASRLMSTQVAASSSIDVRGAGRGRIARAGDAAARREPTRLGGGPGPPLPGPVLGGFERAGVAPGKRPGA